MHVANAITVQTKATALLSGAEEASLCRGSRVWEEGKKKARRAKQSKAEQDVLRAFYFSIIVISIGLPSRSLCEGERGDSIRKCKTLCNPICNSSSCDGR